MDDQPLSEDYENCDHAWIPSYEMGSAVASKYLCCNCGVTKLNPAAAAECNHEWAPGWEGGRLRGRRFEACIKCGVTKGGMTNQTSSAGRWWGKSIVYGKDAEHSTPYMTRYWIGRLRLHVFHRPDQDPDCHDHPWDFWTFPFHSYVEEVVETHYGNDERWTRLQIVPAWWPSFRPATHTHRVLGRYAGFPKEFTGFPTIETRPGTIVTLVWRSPVKRPWGFLKNRDGRWCWTPWKEYVFGGGKSAPCE